MEHSPNTQKHNIERSMSLRSSHAPSKTSRQPWVHLFGGACGGFATAILTSPLDVLRTRLQSDFYRDSNNNIRSNQETLIDKARAIGRPRHTTVQIITSIYRSEGWKTFFRGLGPSLTGVVPATAIKFYVYGNCKRIGAELLGYQEDEMIVHAQAAICAGIVTSTATNPIWLVKTRLQLDKLQTTASGGRQYRNSVDCVRQVIRSEGLRGLYRGLSASYLGSLETALHLVLYERFKSIFRLSIDTTTTTTEHRSAAWNEIANWISTSGAAGSAKLVAGLIAYPHEVVRTRLRQAPVENGNSKYAGLFQCLRTICREEGFAGLYGGLTPHMVRAVPSAVITLGIYEFVLRLFGN